MRTHRFDPASFAFGVLFVAIAVVGLTDPSLLAIEDLRWLGPAVLVVLGLALLLSAGRRDRHRESATPAAVPDTTAAVPDTTAAHDLDPARDHAAAQAADPDPDTDPR